jgi:HSP20 family protein
MLSSIPTVFRNSTFDAVSQEMDRLFETAAAWSRPARGAAAAAARWPGVNLYRHEDRLIAEAEIPGYRLEDVEVLAADETLTIRGARATRESEGATPIRIERTVTRFERSLPLPAPIDAEAVEATLADGVLRIGMPLAEAARPRRVEVRALDAGERCEALPEAPAGN